MWALASAIPGIWMGHPKFTSGSAMAEGPRDVLSVEILQLQNIPFEN